MSEQAEIGDLTKLPPEPKRGIPGWLWFLGGGCLLLLVGLVAAGFFAFSAVKDWGDSDVQLARMAEESIAYDAESSELEFSFAFHVLVVDVYLFSSATGQMLMLQDFGERGDEVREQYFSEETGERNFMGIGELDDRELGTIELQGRTLAIMRFTNKARSGASEEEYQAPSGPGAYVDVTPEGEDGLVMAFVIEPVGAERLADETIQRLLKPFHVGPNR